MNLHAQNGLPIAFSDPDSMFSGYTKDDLVLLASCAGDFMLGLDEAGTIIDIAVNFGDLSMAGQWIGRKWRDTVTIESVPKIEQLLERSSHGNAAWRQVTHVHEGEDLPVSYRIVWPQNGGNAIAIGRDLRAISDLQQRLLKAQQSMERDYLHLRQTETRYRLLFDNIAYALMIVDAADLAVQQANSACHALLLANPGALPGKSLASLFAQGSQAELLAYLGAVAVNQATPDVALAVAGGAGQVSLNASPFRQSGRQYWLLTLSAASGDAPARKTDRHILDVVEHMPDAFVLADDKEAVISANRAFAELVQAGTVEQLLGMPLADLIGRTPVDLGLIRKQLRGHQLVRNFATVVHDLNGGEEPVELSATMITHDRRALFGFSVRSIGRRERTLPGADSHFPKSAEQLSALVGRKTLKEIVRESTDLIERMCIEAALIHTADNRASAAEILGLSRQSLYSKLHRHKMGVVKGQADEG